MGQDIQLVRPLMLFTLTVLRPLWFVRKRMAIWLTQCHTLPALAFKIFSQKSRRMVRVFRRSSMCLGEVLLEGGALLEEVMSLVLSRHQTILIFILPHTMRCGT